MGTQTKEQALDLVAAIFVRAGERAPLRLKVASSVAGDTGADAASKSALTGPSTPDLNAEVHHAISETRESGLPKRPAPDLNAEVVHAVKESNHINMVRPAPADLNAELHNALGHRRAS